MANLFRQSHTVAVLLQLLVNMVMRIYKPIRIYHSHGFRVRRVFKQKGHACAYPHLVRVCVYSALIGEIKHALKCSVCAG